MIEEQHVKQRAARAVVLLTARGVVVRILGFIGTLFATALLGPAEFGIAALGLLVTIVAEVAMDSGLAAALVRRPMHEPTSGELGAVLGFQLVVGSVIVACALTAVLVGNRPVQVAGLIALSAPLMALRTPAKVVLERRLQYGPIAVLEALDIAVYQLFLISGVLIGLGVWAFPLATAARGLSGFVFLLATRRVPRTRPSLEPSLLRALLGFGLRFQAQGLIWLARETFLSGGLLLIGGTELVGIWGLAQRLILPIVIILEAVQRVAFTSFSRLLERDPTASHAGQALRLVAVPISGALAALVAAAPPAVPAVFGRDWEDAVAALPGLALGVALAGPILWTVGSERFAQGTPGVVLRAFGLGALLSVGAGLAGASWFGTWALGAGVALGSLVEALIFDRAQRRAGLPSPIAQVAVPLAAAVVAAAAGWALAERVPHPALAAAAGGFSAAILFAGVTTVGDPRLIPAFGRALRAGLAKQGATS